MRATFATVLFLAVFTSTVPAQTGKSSSSKDSETKSITSYGGKSLADWKKQLVSKDASKRSMAILAVMQFGNDASTCVPLLIDRSMDRDISPKSKALLALRFIAVDDKDIKKVVDALAQRINPAFESQAVVRYEAALTLKRFHKDAKPAIPALIAGTRDKGSWELRHQCAWILWRVAADAEKGPPPDAVDALIVLVRDPTYHVKLEAIQGLGGIGLPRDSARQRTVLDLLQTCTNTTNPDNRPLTLWAFASLVNLQEDTQAKAPLNKLAKFLDSKDLEIRAQAAQAIGSLGAKAKAKVPDLIKMLKDTEPVAVQGACLALRGVGDNSDKVIDALLDVLKHKEPTCAAAAVVTLVGLKANSSRVTGRLDKMLDDKKLHIGLRGTIEEGLKTLKKTGK